MKTTTLNPRNSERGNAFLFILLGIALFAALAFTISRGMRSTTTSTMSSRDAELAATDILSYAQRLERGLSALRRKNISENDIDLDNAIVTGYAHTPPQPDANKLFNPSGGQVSWQSPPPGVNDGSPWHFTGETCIPDIGTGGTTCHSDGGQSEELIVVLPNMNATVCERIDAKLGIGAIPTDTGGGYSTAKFTGDFSDGTKIVLPSAYNTACYTDGTDYFFYSVLLAR